MSDVTALPLSPSHSASMAVLVLAGARMWILNAVWVRFESGPT